LRISDVLTRYRLCNGHLVVTSPARIIETRAALLIDQSKRNHRENKCALPLPKN
jgi:hypothetical protein